MAYSEPVFLAEVLPEIQSRLRAGRCVRIYPKGVSMEPMLKGGRDSVMLAPLTLPPRKYAVMLYRRENGQFVLHRVVRVHEKSCDFCGDNQFVVEKNVPYAQLIAQVTSFTRNGRETGCDAAGYRLYSLFWCWSRPFRRQILRVRRLAGRVKYKIKGT